MATSAADLKEVDEAMDSIGNEKNDGVFGDIGDEDDNRIENQEEEEDDDDDDDEVNRRDDGEAESEVQEGSSDSEDSDSSDDSNEGGLSSLEKRRFERIRRNKEVLSRLGLADLKPMSKPKQQRPRDKREVDPGDVRKSSRKSKKEVNYVEMPVRFQMENGIVRDPASKKRKSNGERPKEKRMERFIYHEFLRLRSLNRHELKMAEKTLKSAQLEFKHAAKAANAVTRRIARKQLLEKVSKDIESEKRKFGKSLRDIVQDIDRRQMEIQSALHDFDYNYVSPEKLEHLEKQRLEQERKMEMIDATNGLPNAIQEAAHHLNCLLAERAPNDPPPARQSDRKRRDSIEGKKGSAAVPIYPDTDDKTDTVGWQNLSAAIAAERPSKIIDCTRSAPDEADDIDANCAQAKVSKRGGPRRRNPNVGGWVSPSFACQIDRSWLAGDQYESKLNLSTYVPQAGDIILYYPSGHRDFLLHHPDVLGKKLRSISRVPLWERARKEKNKVQALEDKGKIEISHSEPVASVTVNQKQPEWFNDEWLAGVDVELGNYPLICRVERTHAEFPPVPEVSEVFTEEGVRKVVFKQSKPKKKNKKLNPPLRLAVMLKPMTPLTPPTRDHESQSLCDVFALSPPPVFQVVTFPSKCAPFIIPFSYGYRVAHSLCLGEKVKSLREKQFIGVLNSFTSIDEKYGSGRIDDCASRVASVLAYFKGEGAASLASSLEASLFQAKGLKLTLPLADAGVVIDTMASRTTCIGSTAAALNESDVKGCLINLIARTLPLWKSVSVLLEGGQSVRVSPWELQSSALTRPSSGTFDGLTDHVLAGNGLMYHIDEALRAKIECSLEDFTKVNDESLIFVDSVTDDMAPSYSCAVPLGMCFRKILRRLSHRKSAGGEQAHSYYRTLDSLLNDVGSILDNCILYNSADSDIVEQGCRVVADAKTQIEQLASRHQKEQVAREKADEERRRKITLQYNAVACVHSNRSVSSVTESKNSKSRRSSHSVDEQTMQGPFTVALNRSWIERTDPDSSWSAGTDSMRTSTHTRTAWVPQSGDAVLYSRFLHSEFIKGHHESLLTEQCNLPQFVLQSGTATSDATPPDAQRAHGMVSTFASPAPAKRDNEARRPGVVETAKPLATAGPRDDGCVYGVSDSADQGTVEAGFSVQPGVANNEAMVRQAVLAFSIHSQFLVGRIVWVRRAFPRNPLKKDIENDTFDVRSPLLSLGISFDYPWSHGPQIHTVYWRPCMISNPSGASDNCICPSCGCQADFGFLLPAWLYHSSQTGSAFRRQLLLPDQAAIDSQSFFYPPVGLDGDSISAIDRCLNSLKRRCITGIPPDFVPEKFDILNVKKGWIPSSKTACKTLPAFEYLFADGSDMIGDSDRTSIRGVAQNRKSENLEEQEKAVISLAEIHYIPPFLKSNSSFKSKAIHGKERKQRRNSYEESMCPSPRLSLELIQQRLQKGYYRHKNGLIDDIQEAYVSSVLLVLSRQASNKFGSGFSVKKFTRSLVTTGMVKNPLSRKGGKTSTHEESNNGRPQQNTEEDSRAKEIHMVRSLYAMALASVSVTRFVECILGTCPKKAATNRLREPSEQHQRFMAAREKLLLLLTTLSRDPGNNRGRPKFLPRGATAVGNQEGVVYPSVTVNITSALPLAETHEELPPIVFSPQDYANLDDLVRCFFGKTGRMEACGRCQVSRRSMLVCRVQRGHLNQDLNWDRVMTGVGGVDGLLHTLKYGSTPPLALSESQPREVGMSEEPLNEALTSEVSMQQDAEKSEEDASKDKHVLLLFERASRALFLAEKRHTSAKEAAESTPRLSDDFIRNSFPIDPADGHYNYCSICGLSGDVICCEKCPVVMHSLCAGSEGVPEGDWFCPKCSAPDTEECRRGARTEAPENATANHIPADAARGRCGESENKEMHPLTGDSSANAEVCAASSDKRKAGIAAGAKSIMGSVTAPSDVEHLIDDNVVENSRLLAADAMRNELETLLTDLREYRLSQNPSRIKKKDDQEEEHPKEHPKERCEDAVVDAKDSVDPEPETKGGGKDAEDTAISRICQGTSSLVSEELNDECPQASEGGNELQAIGIGSKVSKDFGEDGRFLGVVQALPDEEYPFYSIRYEDGDEEDMDEDEIREFLIFIKPPRKRKAIPGGEESSRKRGRKSSQGSFAESASFLKTFTSSRPAGLKVEFKPGVRVIPKKLRQQGKVGTIVRSVDRHTWEVKFDDGRKRGPFRSQQLSFLEDASSDFDEHVEPSPAANVMHLHDGVRVFPRKWKWRDKVGTIVKSVAKHTWEVKFDDGVDRGTFKSLQLTFAEPGEALPSEAAVEADDDDHSTMSSNTGPIAVFKPGVRVVPKKNIYKFKSATIVRSAGSNNWVLKFDDGVDRGTFTTQQLYLLDEAQILPSLDVDSFDGVKKEFKAGVRVLPKKKVYQGKLATIIRSCGRSEWELKFDDGVDRGPFTSQQLSFIADTAEEPPSGTVVASNNDRRELKVGVRVVPKSKMYEGKLGTIISFSRKRWTVKFDDGDQHESFKPQQLSFAQAMPMPKDDAKSDCNHPGEDDGMARTLQEIDVNKSVDNAMAPTDGQRRRRGRPRKTEIQVVDSEGLSCTGGNSNSVPSQAVVETRMTPRKRGRE